VTELPSMRGFSERTVEIIIWGNFEGEYLNES